VLVADGFDPAGLASLQAQAKSEKAVLAIIAPKVGGAKDSAGKMVEAEMALNGAPSIFFDTVAVLAGPESGAALAGDAAAVEWVHDAFTHCKVLGHNAAAQPLLDAAGVKPDGEPPRFAQVAAPALITGVLAWGMWRARYWAVVGFQLVLVFLIFASFYGLALEANSLGGFLASGGLLVVSATFFVLMVKAMARIQMPHRLPPEGDDRRDL
jgi:hypothetical protein